MPEPTSTAAGGVSLTVIAVALLGPMAGPYALIVFAALAGALWPLSGAEAMSRRAGAWLLLRCTLTAIMLTGALAGFLQTQYQIKDTEAFAPIAFFVGALGNGWRPVLAAVGAAIKRLLGTAP